jgi:hypothetical protein
MALMLMLLAKASLAPPSLLFRDPFMLLNLLSMLLTLHIFGNASSIVFSSTLVS